MSEQRREQIIDAAIQVIAREGAHGLSFAKVVDQAGLSSTRLISYHFGTREQLLQETFAHVLRRAAAFMGPRIAQQATIRDKLMAYIRSNMEFIAEDATLARAAVDLAAALAQPGSPDALTQLEDTLRAGQRAGELRSFDPQVMAVALRGMIDASVVDVVTRGTDAAAVGAVLADTFDRAIRA